MNIDRVKIETIVAEQEITYAVLSKRCGISRQSISTIMRRGTCEARTAGKIAKGLGVHVSAIVAKEG